MTIKQQLDADIKSALLGGDKDRTTVLRGLKSAILYVEVAEGSRESGLAEDKVQAVLAKEAKKRQESAELYTQGGNADKAAAELAEKGIIETYLPAQLDEAALNLLVDAAITETAASSPAQMGQVIAAVKAKAGANADGAMVARLVKQRLTAIGAAK